MMERKFALRYAVVWKNGVGDCEIDAGFNDIREAMEYADIKASEGKPFDTGYNISVASSSQVAHFEVIDTREVVDGWESKYETKSFYNY